MKKIVSHSIKNFSIYIFLGIIVVFTLFPLIYAFFASFKGNIELFVGSASLLPKEWLVSNYVDAWTKANFARYTFNSVFYATATTFLAVINASMVGYVFSRGRFPGRKLIIAVFTSTMFISVGALMLFPLIEISKILGTSHSLWGLILINGIGVNIPAYYLVARYVSTIPRELDDAAMVDGCSFFSIWWRIIFPISKPVAATVGLLAFMGAWNDFLLPYVFTIGNDRLSPLTVGIVSLQSDATSITSYGLMLAGTAMSLIPVIVMFSIVNKYFVQGLTGGALKG
ncbi:MAG: carbohydrate ABC transporter permease [Halanaerobiales bacterium]